MAGLALEDFLSPIALVDQRYEDSWALRPRYLPKLVWPAQGCYEIV